MFLTGGDSTLAFYAGMIKPDFAILDFESRPTGNLN